MICNLIFLYLAKQQKRYKVAHITPKMGGLALRCSAYILVSRNRMKTIVHILTLGLLTTFFSCGQLAEKKNIATQTTDTLQTKLDKKENERLEKRKKIEAQENTDSIRLDNILQYALKITHQNFGKERFCEKDEVSTNRIPADVSLYLSY